MSFLQRLWGVLNIRRIERCLNSDQERIDKNHNSDEKFKTLAVDYICTSLLKVVHCYIRLYYKVTSFVPIQKEKKVKIKLNRTDTKIPG